ncbi:HD domain-containing protein [Candidatus Pacearchaeota archaeon]|nr:HD domain-containing protein [Candidatus Pacearchaeota archaeon]
MEEEFFNKLKERVLPYFEDGGGHGFDHVERVYSMAIKISRGENVDMDVVRAAALLHDIARSKEDKFDVCHAEEGVKMACEILKEVDFPVKKIKDVVHAIGVHRYSKNLKAESREAEILQDADRLDVLGAVIVGRAFEKAGKEGTIIYDSDMPIKENYGGCKTCVINHFYEKSLKITPESFKTVKAREIAKGRYDFVKEFVERYVKELKGRIMMERFKYIGGLR